MADPDPHTHRGHRYLQLIEQLGQEIGKARGWQTRVAERLGVSRYVVSNMVRGKRDTVSSQTLDEAMKRLGLDPAFFDAAEGHYTRFLVGPHHGVTLAHKGHKRTVTTREDALRLLSKSDTELVTSEAARLVQLSDRNEADAEAARAFCRAVLGLPYFTLVREAMESGQSAQGMTAAAIQAAKAWLRGHTDGQDEAEIDRWLEGDDPD